MTDWNALTTRTLEELKEVDARFRPTNFWGPGLDQLLDDLHTHGLENFKSWPTAGFWFYPMYAPGATPQILDESAAHAKELNPRFDERAVRNMLAGYATARRDFDAARLAWNHSNWPIRLRRFGESSVGKQPELFRLTAQRHGWTRPYLNYMLCMAALSRHVERRPTSFLEVGGGFGVLGEFLMRRWSDVRYVDLDIPPLLTVASYYLRELFGDRVAHIDDLPATGPLTLDRSAVLPNWRLPDVRGPFDVFVNSFSFQEMEPDVVSSYIADVVAADVEYVVSLNSEAGKPRLSDGARIGVAEPVTSGFIAAEFESHGYTVLRRYGSPLLASAGQLVVLRRTDKIEAQRRASSPVRRAVKRVRG